MTSDWRKPGSVFMWSVIYIKNTRQANLTSSALLTFQYIVSNKYNVKILDYALLVKRMFDILIVKIRHF